jgi:hypothetical protein
MAMQTNIDVTFAILRRFSSAFRRSAQIRRSCASSSISSSSSSSHHAVLRVAPGADADAIKAAYLDAVWKTHPDRDGGDAANFRRVQEAFDALRTEVTQSGDRFPANAPAASAPSARAAPGKAAPDVAWREWSSMSPSELSSAAAERLIELTITGAGARGLRDAQALLLACKERGLFPDAAGETAAYNSLLWHCSQGFTEATIDEVMDTTLNILKVMDQNGLQPDLEVLEQIFRFHG